MYQRLVLPNRRPATNLQCLNHPTLIFAAIAKIIYLSITRLSTAMGMFAKVRK